MADEKRIFSEQEVGAIMRRAVELQEKAGSEYQPGVTETELQRIAKEIGVDPKFLSQAIHETGKMDEKSGPLNLTAEFERVVDVELKPEDFDVLLGHLKAFGRRHPLTQVGRTLSGRTWTGCSFANVEITSRKGRTKVNVKSNPLFAYLVAYHPALIGSFVALGSLGSAGMIWLGLAIIVPVLMVMTLVFNMLVKKGHKAAKKLTDELADEVEKQRDSDLNIQPTDAKAEEPSAVQQVSSS